MKEKAFAIFFTVTVFFGGYMAGRHSLEPKEYEHVADKGEIVELGSDPARPGVKLIVWRLKMPPDFDRYSLAQMPSGPYEEGLIAKGATELEVHIIRDNPK